VVGFFQKRRINKFWKWFLLNPPEIGLEMLPKREEAKRFQVQLAKMNADFRYKVLADEENAGKKIVFYCETAEVIPVGRVLLEKAPILPEWQFVVKEIAFNVHMRQIAEAEERLVRPEEVFFTYDVNRETRKFRLDIYVNPEGRDQDTVKRGVYANIRKAIGDDAFEQKIGEIYIRPVEQKGREDRLLTFKELLFAVKYGM